MVLGLAAVLLFAATVQNITGFGFSLLAMPLMTLVIDTKEAVAVASLVGTLATCLLFLRARRHVRWSMAGWLVAGAFAGMPFGLAVLLAVEARWLKLTVAITVVAFVVILARGWRIEEAGPRVELAAGFLSGVLNTSLSTNGPPLVLALQARGLEPEEFRGTISAVFIASSVLGNVLLGAAGRYTPHVLGYAAVGAPMLFVGAFAGIRIGRRVPASQFRPMVLWLLVVAALSAGVSAALA